MVCLFSVILLLSGCDWFNPGPDEEFLIEVSQSSVLLFEGDTLQLIATLYDADSLIVEVEVGWQSSAVAVASVSDSGLVTGLTDGYADIIVSYNEQSDTIAVYVQKSLSFTKYSGNPVMEIGSTNDWDGYYLWDLCVRDIDGEYCMWYEGVDSSNNNLERFGFASSGDGITWTKYASNPLGVIGEADSSISGPSIIFTGSEYMLWYSIPDNATNNKIHYSNSSDGITWTKPQDDPVLTASQEWENSKLGYCSVVSTDNGYLMYYDGNKDEIPEIGLASSEDGISWTKFSGNPVLTLNEGEWPSAFMYTGDIIIKDDVLHMFYTGGNSLTTGIAKIGHAVSLDGINWLQDPGNPILSPGQGNHDAVHLFNPTVCFEEDGTVKMWYGGAPYIGYIATLSYNLAISE